MMNYGQRFLVIGSLVVIGLVLAFVFLSWGEGAFSSLGGDRIAIVVFYQDPQYRNSFIGSGYGIYTTHGITGVILGLVAPLCFFAAAAFVALGTKVRK
jgi:hypothetical protein